MISHLGGDRVGRRKGWPLGVRQRAQDASGPLFVSHGSHFLSCRVLYNSSTATLEIRGVGRYHRQLRRYLIKVGALSLARQRPSCSELSDQSEKHRSFIRHGPLSHTICHPAVCRECEVIAGWGASRKAPGVYLYIALGVI